MLPTVFQNGSKMGSLLLNEKKLDRISVFRFIFQSRNTTLTDNQVDIVLNDIMTNCINIDSVKIPGFNNELN